MEITANETSCLYTDFKVLIKYGTNILNPIKDFHVIVPILPGHNPNDKEDFVSFSETAKELEDYYISRYGKNVYAVYSMSMGGVLTATLWQNRR